MSLLGWCIPCRVAANNGGTDNPFERAEYILGGVGMCPACMLALAPHFVTPLQLQAFGNVPGRRPPRKDGNR